MRFGTPIWMQCFAVFVLTAITALGQTVGTNSVIAYTGQVFVLAQKAFAAHPDEATNAWMLGRACYDWAEFSTNEEQRASIAQAGINACRRLVARDQKSALGHYYLGMNYGELAEAKAPSMAAYKLIRDIEHEFKVAVELDERIDFAGPVRSLGLLYRDAPGWPLSIGNRRKAREYLERAATLAPDYPDNQMNLVESYIRWREAPEAEAAWRKLATIWPAARTNLTGMAWEASWDDWTKRRAAAETDFQRAFRRALPQ